MSCAQFSVTFYVIIIFGKFVSSSVAQKPITQLDCGIITPPAIRENSTKQEPNYLPWHANLYQFNGNFYGHFCSGVLVSYNVVLTAAECFYDDTNLISLNKSKFVVTLGKLWRHWTSKLNQYEQILYVSSVKVHEYSGLSTNYKNDLAVVKLAGLANYTSHVIPVCFSMDPAFQENLLREGNVGKVAGWSETKKLQRVQDVPFIPQDKCSEAVDASFKNHVIPDKFCVGSINTVTICKGMAGAGVSFPALLDNQTRHFLVGIVSVGPKPPGSRCGWLTTATRLSYHLNFIEI